MPTALIDKIGSAIRAKAGGGTTVMNGAAIAAACDFLIEAIDALERKLDSGPFRFMGPHQAGTAYSKGDFAVFQGSLWHCNSSTRERPGSGFDWTLCCKKGRSGRDAR